MTYPKMRVIKIGDDYGNNDLITEQDLSDMVHGIRQKKGSPSKNREHFKRSKGSEGYCRGIAFSAPQIKRSKFFQPSAFLGTDHEGDSRWLR